MGTVAAALSVRDQPNLEGFPGCALLLDVRSGRVLVRHGSASTAEWAAAPGSTVKPLSLWALLRSGRIMPDESILCQRHLRLGGLKMDCSHPPLPFPVTVARAITYSCNYATAHFAERFRKHELAGLYREFGFDDSVASAVTGEKLQLQALGEHGVRATAQTMVEAYRRLARLVPEPKFAPILEGLEGAVAFGTGQAAQVNRVVVAGKTGSVQTEPGIHAAWFAGFAPSRNPQVAIAVQTQGPSGAQAAAPIAGEMLRRFFFPEQR